MKDGLKIQAHEKMIEAIENPKYKDIIFIGYNDRKHPESRSWSI